jgi:hypothetical protein
LFSISPKRIEKKIPTKISAIDIAVPLCALHIGWFLAPPNTDQVTCTASSKVETTQCIALGTDTKSLRGLKTFVHWGDLIEAENLFYSQTKGGSCNQDWDVDWECRQQNYEHLTTLPSDTFQVVEVGWLWSPSAKRIGVFLRT